MNSILIDTEHLYKDETGSFPVKEIQFELILWRSKGQWIIDISDEEKFRQFGNDGIIQIPRADLDYLEWLENKVMELIRKI